MGYTLSERYRMDDTDQEIMPLSYQILQKYQNRDKILQNKVNSRMIKTQYFHGAGSCIIELATHNNKKFIPKSLCNNVIDWCHT